MIPSHPLTDATSQLVTRVRTVADCSPLPMAATEGRAHVLRYMNPAFGALLGQDAARLVGRPLGVPSAERQLLEQAAIIELLDQVYATGIAGFTLDLGQLLGATGISHLPCTVWPILASDDGPGGLLVQAGWRAQRQAELETTLRGQAEAALTLRDQFLATAAHELRNPATGIKAAAQLAQRAVNDANPASERIRQYLGGIVDGANRLVLLIDDLMDVSRIRTGKPVLNVAAIDLVGLVSAVAQRHVETLDERHRLATDLPAGPILISADAVRLEQVLDNLLGNAVKYSPAGGVVSLRLCRLNGGLELAVADSGIGVPAGDQERIFEPFGRAANARRQGLPGLGLGLHICRQIAEAHRGRMWAESEGEGRGLIVRLWLPEILAAPSS